MADICDDAQEAEAYVRQAALANMPRPDQGPGPQLINGKLCCVECDAEISAARLAAVPGCSRCPGCQEEEELLARQSERA